MRRKKPLFLLEIVIAIFLVGLFSVYFLRSSIHYIYQERKALLELGFEKEYDLKRMELLQAHWRLVDQLPSKDGDAKEESYTVKVEMGGKWYSKTKKFKIWCRSQENIYDLVLKEDKKKYHFLVKKDTKVADVLAEVKTPPVPKSENKSVVSSYESAEASATFSKER
jgi:hypothetical protein